MHLHVLGVCGTFMAGVAELALRLGHRVSGSDQNMYPPMSEFLADSGVELIEGYVPSQLAPEPDLVIFGNALSRGNPVVEAVLDRHIPYTSGPQWLNEFVLPGRHVIAVSGTHGKTTTTALLMWILQQHGYAPGYLIGGMANDFERPAHLGEGRYFIVEADEYDTAFFDKRSKFVHYQPDTLIINNLEFDHADIFRDLQAIETQFHHLVRTVPGNGLIISLADDLAIERVLARGCWSRRESFGAHKEATWQLISEPTDDAHNFGIRTPERDTLELRSALPGLHNQMNATAAIAAANDVGIEPSAAAAAVASFGGVKRRLELIGCVNDIAVYDDFAHHPTAIRATLKALRRKVHDARVWCLLEPRSNTMRRGVHAAELGDALADADYVQLYADEEITWDTTPIAATLGERCKVTSSIDEIIESVANTAKPGDHVVGMSNGAFGNIHRRLLSRLEATQ